MRARAGVAELVDADDSKSSAARRVGSSPSTGTIVAMNYCSHCGQPVELRVPAGDNLARHVCVACATIHYQNPKIVVGCVPEHDGQILLCRRAIEPRLGYWTIPAGFMENGETLQAAAARESWEEALARVDVGTLLAVVNVVHAQQVHIMFRATLPTADYGVGAESLEVRLYRPGDIPWPEIAFPSVEFALRRYLEDRERGLEGLHLTDFDRPAWRRGTGGP
jgi:ADP-ribose pyrophosphatase YjhB (NUDIX family)